MLQSLAIQQNADREKRNAMNHGPPGRVPLAPVCPVKWPKAMPSGSTVGDHVGAPCIEWGDMDRLVFDPMDDVLPVRAVRVHYTDGMLLVEPQGGNILNLVCMPHHQQAMTADLFARIRRDAEADEPPTVEDVVQLLERRRKASGSGRASVLVAEEACAMLARIAGLPATD
jgi:hypothetical protein